MSDRYGRRAVLTVGYLGFILIVLPTFLVMSNSGSFLVVGLFYFMFMVLSGTSQVPTWALAAELFPVKVRYTGIALGYNIGAIVAGGTAPLVATYLVEATGESTSPAIWVMLVACVGLISLRTMQRRDHIPLATTDEEIHANERPKATV